MGDQREAGWDEDDSALFLEMGALFTPRREEIAATLTSLIPAAPTDPFHGVELGVGAGWLTEAVLRRFPNASMLGLDGSPAMLDAASERLAPFGARFTPGRFALEDSTWIDRLPSDLQCILSSLTLHHLDDAGKRSLYARLRRRLAPGGALLIADIVAPASEQARRAMAASWDADVRQQSIDVTGDERAFERFQAERWNIFTYPDPEVDKPSTLPDHLAWLAEAGFVGADVFWARSGHAVYGGFVP
ncbi:MAG TPA: class I SAM-dependent methyltransferase [Thermomicrobiales bacterium]|nr:class I SAM-dependent methyltransferase [Thermomicrobiales bacterium]